MVTFKICPLPDCEHKYAKQPIKNFGKKKIMPDGYSKRCKSCVNKYTNEYRWKTGRAKPSQQSVKEKNTNTSGKTFNINDLIECKSKHGFDATIPLFINIPGIGERPISGVEFALSYTLTENNHRIVLNFDGPKELITGTEESFRSKQRDGKAQSRVNFNLKYGVGYDMFLDWFRIKAKQKGWKDKTDEEKLQWINRFKIAKGIQ